ncbi:hypothetical protein MSAN_00593300 [Mycena sanguinolenta]|uniref:DUF6589 domain-containing protein n=1 Tax=Mycena sanguinolenta TaxID=230812 RepID=A0A8H6ZBG8_9AGAR|nr:hypothetical protein MSAN_00593300 [Mycena sanguinolenta]
MAAYNAACDRGDAQRDAMFENSMLYNRDSLLYLLLVSLMKAGDIGHVILVFRIWAVMMQSPKTMPKYADAFFETLNRIKTYDPVLQRFFLHNWLVNLTGLAFRFKEVDLLQEHQNFWAKIVYNAKGVNRSWSWLARITVCILPSYCAQHAEQICRVAEALEKDRLQELWSQRLWKDQVVCVHDLFEEGANYLNTRGAFLWYMEPTTVSTVILTGSDVKQTNSNTADSEDDNENVQEDYEVTQEDLKMDDEEPYDMISSLLDTAEVMADDMIELNILFTTQI